MTDPCCRGRPLKLGAALTGAALAMRKVSSAISKRRSSIPKTIKTFTGAIKERYESTLRVSTGWR